MPAIACGEDAKDKGIANPVINWNDRYVSEDGSNDLPTTEQGSHFSVVYSKDGNNWSSSFSGLGTITLGDYVWAKQVADKGYYLENGDNMGKVEISQLGPLQINKKQFIPTSALPATVGGDMLKLNIPNITGTRFIFATTQGFYQAKGDENGIIDPSSINLIASTTTLPLYVKDGSTSAKVIQTSPTHVIFLTGDYEGRAAAGSSEHLYQADLDSDGSVVTNSIADADWGQQTVFYYNVKTEDSWIAPIFVDPKTNVAKAIWFAAKDTGSGIVICVNLINGKVVRDTSVVSIDETPSGSGTYPGSRMTVFWANNELILAQKEQLTLVQYEPAIVNNEVTFGGNPLAYNRGSFAGGIDGFLADSKGTSSSSIIIGAHSQVGLTPDAIAEAPYSGSGASTRIDSSKQKILIFDAKYKGLQQQNLKDSTIQIIAGKYALIATQLGIYAVKINPADGTLDTSQVQMVPVGSEKYFQLASTKDGYVKAWDKVVYVQTVEGLNQVPLKDWSN